MNHPEIIEPIGTKAREHDGTFQRQKSGLVNIFTKLFVERFCDAKGVIDWVRVVQDICGNYDLDKVISKP